MGGAKASFGKKIRQAFTKVLAASLAIFSAAPVVQNLIPSAAQAAHIVGKSKEKLNENNNDSNKTANNSLATMVIEDTGKKENDVKKQNVEIKQKRKSFLKILRIIQMVGIPILACKVLKDRNKIKDLSHNNIYLNSQIRQLNEDNESLSIQLAQTKESKDIQIRNLSKDLSQFRSTNQSLSTQNGLLSRKITKIENEQIETQTLNTNLSQENNSLNAKITESKEAQKKLSNEVSGKINKIARLKEEKSILDEENQKLRERIKAIQHLETKNTELDFEIQRLEKQIQFKESLKTKRKQKCFQAWKNYVFTWRHFEQGKKFIETGKIPEGLPIVIIPEITEENITAAFIKSRIKLFKDKYCNLFKDLDFCFLLDLAEYIDMYSLKERNVNLRLRSELGGFGYNTFHKDFFRNGNNVFFDSWNDLSRVLGKCKEQLEKNFSNDDLFRGFVEVFDINYQKAKNFIDNIIESAKAKGISDEETIRKKISEAIQESPEGSLRNFLSKYVKRSYGINCYLRHEGKLPSNIREDNLQQAVEYVSKHKIPSMIMLYRYVTFDTLTKMFPESNFSQELVQNMQGKSILDGSTLSVPLQRLNSIRGQVFFDKGFVSTTIQKGLAEDLRFGGSSEINKVKFSGIYQITQVELEISAPENTQGIYLPNEGGLSRCQKEFLLAPGQKYKLIGARIAPPGYHAKVIVKLAILPNA